MKGGKNGNRPIYPFDYILCCRRIIGDIVVIQQIYAIAALYASVQLNPCMQRRLICQHIVYTQYVHSKYIHIPHIYPIYMLTYMAGLEYGLSIPCISFRFITFLATTAKSIGTSFLIHKFSAIQQLRFAATRTHFPHRVIISTQKFLIM